MDVSNFLFYLDLAIKKPLIRLPHNGDTAPKVLVFFIDSQFINVFLIFETIFLKMHSTNNEKPKIWIQDIVSKISKTKVGQKLAPETLKSEDGLAESGKTSTANLTTRQNFRILLDRFFICLYIFIYFVMFKKLMPDEYKP